MASPESTSVFILAAGRGERMRPLTDSVPKPLLKVNGKSLIVYHLEKLAELGFKDIIINIDYLGQQIIDQLGSGESLGLNIQYSDERPHGALETAGGIHKALDLINSPDFICLNADVWTDYNFQDLLRKPAPSVVLVSNPDHNPLGDFIFNPLNNLASQRVKGSELTSYTFSGIGYYRKKDFEKVEPGKQKLAQLLFEWGERNKLLAEIHNGKWIDIGTPQRLEQLNQTFESSD